MRYSKDSISGVSVQYRSSYREPIRILYSDIDGCVYVQVMDLVNLLFYTHSLTSQCILMCFLDCRPEF